MKYKFVPTEELDQDDDNGTMVENVAMLAENVVGHRIVYAAMKEYETWCGSNERFEITLDNGKKVTLANTYDCCAYTELSSFLWNAEKIDHIITGVRTEEGYTKWSIFADMGDILTLSVGWSCGNPFYYGYGFEIGVEDCEPNND